MIAQQLMVLGFAVFATGTLGMVYALADDEQVMGPEFMYRYGAAVGAATMAGVFWIAPWHDPFTTWVGRALVTSILTLLVLPEVIKAVKAIYARTYPVA